MATYQINLPYVVLPSPPPHPMELERARREAEERARAAAVDEMAIRLFMQHLTGLAQAASPDDLDAAYGILAGLWERVKATPVGEVLQPLYVSAVNMRKRLRENVARLWDFEQRRREFEEARLEFERRQLRELGEAQLSLGKKRLERAQREIDLQNLKERLASDIVSNPQVFEAFNPAVQALTSGDWESAVRQLSAFYESHPQYAHLGAAPLLDFMESIAQMKYSAMMRDVQLRMQQLSLAQMVGRLQGNQAVDEASQVAASMLKDWADRMLDPSMLDAHESLFQVVRSLYAMDRVVDAEQREALKNRAVQGGRALAEIVSRSVGMQGGATLDEYIGSHVAQAVQQFRNMLAEHMQKIANPSQGRVEGVQFGPLLFAMRDIVAADPRKLADEVAALVVQELRDLWFGGSVAEGAKRGLLMGAASAMARELGVQPSELAGSEGLIQKIAASVRRSLSTGGGPLERENNPGAEVGGQWAMRVLHLGEVPRQLTSQDLLAPLVRAAVRRAVRGAHLWERATRLAAWLPGAGSGEIGAIFNLASDYALKFPDDYQWYKTGYLVELDAALESLRQPVAEEQPQGEIQYQGVTSRALLSSPWWQWYFTHR